eukprot:TRINITY_DN8009_c0_g1_i1.p1 TRINITY_DN8009_c0_g1~~TRINITY_DN8009_c0_g1_i1.p1  ORF type:complete len:718 (+),score=161.73 TRINITY_DN8009_c0_g1_i1:37-2190(+)
MLLGTSSPPTKGYNSDDEYIPGGMRRSVSSSTPPPYMVSTKNIKPVVGNKSSHYFQSEMDIIKKPIVPKSVSRTLSDFPVCSVSQSPVVVTPELPIKRGTRSKSGESSAMMGTNRELKFSSTSPNNNNNNNNIDSSQKYVGSPNRMVTDAAITDRLGVRAGLRMSSSPEHISRSPGDVCYTSTNITNPVGGEVTSSGANRSVEPSQVRLNTAADASFWRMKTPKKEIVDEDQPTPPKQSITDMDNTDFVTQLKIKLSKQHVLLLEKDAKINSLQISLQASRQEATAMKSSATEAENGLLELDKLLESKGAYWKDHKDALEQKIADSKKAANDLQEQLLICTTKMQLDRADHLHAIQEYEHKLEQSRDSMMKITLQKEQLQKKIADKSEANKALIETLNNTGHRQNTEVSEIRNSYIMKGAADRQSIHDQQLIINQLKASNNALQETVAELKQQLSDISKKHNDEMMAQKASHDESLSDLTSQLKSAKKENQHLQEDIANAKSDLLNEQKRSHSQQASLTSFRQSSERAALDNKDLQTVIIALKKDLMDRNSSVAVETEKFQLHISNLKKENEELKKDLEEANQSIVIQSATVQETLTRKEEELRHLEDRYLGIKQLNPSQMLDTDVDEIVAKEAFVRTVLSQCLGDVLWLQSAVRDFKKVPIDPLTDHSQRIVGLSTEVVAKKVQQAFHDLMSAAQSLLLSKRCPSASPDSSDCLMM